jgi:hypothetical protein
MTDILLISEDYIKTHSGLNDNVFGKSIAPAIVVAQDIQLQKYLGSCLYKKILELVDTDTIESEENVHYKHLLDNYITDFLIYQTITNLIPEISTKIVNLGVVYSQDEHTTNVSQGERELVASHYQNIADSYAKYMQLYLKGNRDKFKELDCDCCGGMKPTLDSSASTSLWLGGTRSKRL